MYEGIDKNFIQILSSEYEFNSDSYADLINNSINVEQSKDDFYLLGEMSKSNDYSVIFALSFILEHTSRDFMKKNKNKIADIIITAIKKDYFRANFYFAESLLYVMNRDIDYLAYVDLLIKSNNLTVQDIAITNTFKLPDRDWVIFSKASKDVDFYYMMDDFSEFNNYVAIKDKSHIPLYQKKIVAMGYYKKYHSKKQTYNIFGENNPDIFDFIYFLPEID